jgi:hypothetical protein
MVLLLTHIRPYSVLRKSLQCVYIVPLRVSVNEMPHQPKPLKIIVTIMFH